MIDIDSFVKNNELDDVDWNWLEKYINNRQNFYDKCPFRYDGKEKAIYKEAHYTNAKYTYIAKSAVSPFVYKFGHTDDLNKRAKSLRAALNYKDFQFDVIAYCERDIEFELLAAFGCKHKVKGYNELVLLSEDGLQKVIRIGTFTRIEPSSVLPGKLHKFVRTYYSPTDGHFLKQTTRYSFE